jgi:hypothetical protein
MSKVITTTPLAGRVGEAGGTAPALPLDVTDRDAVVAAARADRPGT